MVSNKETEREWVTCLIKVTLARETNLWGRPEVLLSYATAELLTTEFWSRRTGEIVADAVSALQASVLLDLASLLDGILGSGELFAVGDELGALLGDGDRGRSCCTFKLVHVGCDCLCPISVCEGVADIHVLIQQSPCHTRRKPYKMRV